jgi:O-antigen ligase
MLHQPAYKIYGIAAVFLFMIAVVLSIMFATPALLFIPFALLACFWLIENLSWLLFILLIAIPWSIEFRFSQSLGTDLPDEPLMLLTAFTTLCVLIARRKQLLKKQFVHPLLFILCLQIIWLLVSVVFSTDALVSFKYLLAKGWYLLSFIAAPLLVFRNEVWLKRISIGIAISMLFLVIVTLFRHAFNGLTFATINISLEPFFRNHVNYSAVLVFVIPIFYAAYLLTNKKAFKRLLIAALLILLIAVYFSYARGAWLAIVVGIAAFWLLKKKMLLLLFILFLIISLSSVYWLQRDNNYLKFAHNYNTTIFHTNFEEHLVATYRLKDVSTAERFYRWIAGVRMITYRWQTGFGPNTFSENYKEYAVPAFKTWVSENKDRSTVHNYFLLMFIEQGVIGFLLLLILFGAFFWYAQKIYHAAEDRFWKIVVATATVVFSMICTVNFLSDLVETDKVGSFYYLCIAALIVADFKTRKHSIN